MKTLYESILGSTKSGRSSLPLEFSDYYTPQQIKKVVKDFCKYYEIKNSKLISQIEKSISSFIKTKVVDFFVDSSNVLQSRSIGVSKFRFVKDKYFKNKLLAQTNISENYLIRYFFDAERTLFLILQAEFSKNNKKWYHLHHSPAVIEIKKCSLEEFLKKYENE